MSTVFTFPRIGGKALIAPRLIKTFPRGFTEYREPFVGGGTVALNLMRLYPKAKYWLNDLYPPVWAWWDNLKTRPMEMIARLLELKHGMEKRELFQFCKETIDTACPFEQGCMQFILSRTTWGGAGLRGGYSPNKNRLTDGSIIGLAEPANIIAEVDVQITNMDYSECLGGDGEVFIFADPPYLLERSDLYGGANGELHKNFSHSRFAEKMRNCSHHWAITYNDDNQIRRMYAEYEFLTFDLWYGSGNKRGSELLIKNY